MHQTKESLQRQPSAGRPAIRILAAVLAVLLTLLLIVTVRIALSAWEERYLYRLATSGEDEVVKGMILPGRALRDDSMLLMLGSSELTFQDEYHPAKLFRNKPTGFSTFVVGSGYRQSVHNFLSVSSLDRNLKGKKCVLFVTPSWFTRNIADKAYKKNFSMIQAYEFTFNSSLSPELKSKAAARFLALGAPGTEDPLLKTSWVALASNSWWGKVRYAAVWPVGRLGVEYLKLKDSLELLRRIRATKLPPSGPGDSPREIDWVKLEKKADQEARAKTVSNPFGINDDYYLKFIAPKLNELKDSATTETWLTSSEYGDLQLVLDALREVKAQPLFISLPVAGSYYDFKGHHVDDRRAYYRQVRLMIEKAGFPVVDFGPEEYELGFMRDPWHPGWKGSVRIAETVDQFYHDRLPAPGY